MLTRWTRRLFAGLIISLGCFSTAYGQEEVVLEPIKDNTLFEDDTGSLSNGSGAHLFAGVTGQDRIRRAVLAFDVAGAIPEAATIEAVELTLNVSNSNTGTQTTTLHRLLADWGEGASEADGAEGMGTTATTDDATWIHTFFDTATWQSPGGDFEASPSASQDIGDLGSYTWSSTEALVADVQTWLDDPSGNFGWILIGNETATMTAKRFDSRENPEASVRPALRIEYMMPTAVEADEVPATARLLPAYPNPARATTRFAIELDQPQSITLDVFDVQGRKVAVPVTGVHPAGRHEVVFDAASLPAGLYLYRLTTPRAVSHGTLLVQ